MLIKQECPSFQVAQHRKPQSDTTAVPGSESDPNTGGKRGNVKECKFLSEFGAAILLVLISSTLVNISSDYCSRMKSEVKKQNDNDL